MSLLQRALRLHSLGNHSYLSRGLLGKDSTVVDLGSHRGAFAHGMAALHGCRSFSVEANPALFAQIPSNDRVTKLHYALCGKSGPVRFNISTHADSSSLGKIPAGEVVAVHEIEGISLKDFMDRHGIRTVDLLKVDIEGAEIEMFDSLTDQDISRLNQIAVEFHHFSGTVTEADVQRVIKRLADQGFLWLDCSGRKYFDSLFVHRERCHVSPVEAWYLERFARKHVWRVGTEAAVPVGAS